MPQGYRNSDGKQCGRPGNMPDGSRRGGRKKGAFSKVTLAKEEAVRKYLEERDWTGPFEHMLAIINGIDPLTGEASDEITLDHRCQAAKDAAPYCHAKLQTTQINHSGEVSVLTKEQRDAAVRAALGDVSGSVAVH